LTWSWHCKAGILACKFLWDLWPHVSGFLTILH
jgi:hypothetical protein